ncbi:MAG: VCBS repeat-containing protein [Phycisphaerae bacterium]|nr:VCBS repeat-containing protein [Phycisphaerae bacterium]
MIESDSRIISLGLGFAILVVVAQPCAGEVSGNLLANGSFEQSPGHGGLPAGWSLYGGAGKDQSISLVKPEGSGESFLLLADGDPAAEIGLLQQVAAKGGLTYEASVDVRGVKEARTAGAYLQLRFLPSNQFVQTDLRATSDSQCNRVAVKATAPADTARLTVYLYTHKTPTPKVLLRNARLVSGVQPPPPPPPAPVPPVYKKLKELPLTTPIVRGGKPTVTIIAPKSGAYDEPAGRIQKAVETLTGTKAPIADDASPAAAVPIAGHLIVLGNRSTSQCISELYDRYYTLLDLRYPGPEGYVVRTLHSPFGDGRNVIFVGGSDAAGVGAAADAFIELLRQAGAKPGELSVGRLAEIRLGKGIAVPKDVTALETWEASKGYGSVGYFGWNSLSKRLAAYYMTGDALHAREFIRLAFPDARAKKEIAEIDGERIENKDAPLSGPYHYNAHMMILFWDLVEESPVFTDEERLAVTNAFSQQLNHRKDEGIYRLTKPPSCVGTRHGQWSAISLYCLGRYFQRGYPNPIWQQCMAGARWHFAPLHEHAWVAGENDNLFWYNTAVAPILTYVTLTGDRKPVENGVLAVLLRGQEILVSGREPDSALNSASIGFLNKAVYLTQDGRWLEYRRRTGVDTRGFRLGQSYWPKPDLTPKQPSDLVGKWSINPLPEPMWAARDNGFTQEESFLFGSYRSAVDASGDFILIDGFNGASRNPYHTFAILELRLAGCTLLKGYRNQVLTRADGLVETRIAMNAALKHADVIGQTAIAAAEVPDAAYCDWRRTLLQRIGRYAVVVDDLTFRADSENMQVEILWETEGGGRAFPDGHVECVAVSELPQKRSVPGGQIRCCDVMQARATGPVSTMEWLGPVQKDRHRIFFTLVGMQPSQGPPSMACYRLSDATAMLALPSPAMIGIRGTEGSSAGISLLAEDHYFGRQVDRIILPVREGAKDLRPVFASCPVDADWDFASGNLHIVSSKDTRLELDLADPSAVRLNGKPLPQGQREVNLPAGRHVLAGARPAGWDAAKTRSVLAENLTAAKQQRERDVARKRAKETHRLPRLQATFTTSVGGRVVDLVATPNIGRGSQTSPSIYAAEGRTIHALTAQGREVQRLATDGPIRMLRWWPEHGLLLAGCADEKVIAFDAAGNRMWTFVSEMDPAVFRAAKTYWFKSAPGHEGIHGLYTGVFLGGKSQAFVGSACTLEILDEHGELIRRMPQFWGTVSHFAIIDAPGGGLNLLASRRYNGSNTVAVIDNKTLNPDRRGFYSVPAGATHVPGWSAMNRDHLFYEDLDGNGTKEVISEINGTWNRVTVWDRGGTALHDASFGPGERISLTGNVKNMRDLDVADLDGDGKKEIVVATSSGLIVALDHQCGKIWATRLLSPPTVMKCVTPPGMKTSRILVGCDDESVIELDHGGKPMRSTKIIGRPTCIDVLTVDGKPVVLIATGNGQVVGFPVGA